jgi:predicted nucleic acid-binding protein
VTEKNYLLIDACVLINLVAIGMMEEILKSVVYESYICTIVRNETIFLRDETDPTELVSIDINLHVDNGLLKICDLETDSEQVLFVNLAARLDDGEAMSLAIALSRHWELATDDKKARRIFRENETKGQELESTSSLIRKWAETEKIGEQKVKEVLSGIEKSARYSPSKSDGNYQWWIDSVS